MSKYTNECVRGFLHADGRKLYNGRGEEVILRGMGVGNWMNPEGFMIGAPLTIGKPMMMGGGLILPDRMDRGRSMDQTIAELCGRSYADAYWIRWMKSYLQEEDIRKMAELGFNSVRLPMSARLILKEEPGYQWREDTLAHLDEVLDWCEKYRIYAILDLHAFPGGQTGLLCDDGLDNQAHFFTEPESFERGIVIWEKLAERYKDRWIVGGYDLMNEPLGPAPLMKYKDKLAEFYDAVIRRIRLIDRNHLLTLEGAACASDLSIFDHDYDPECHNWCIHMHQYGFDGDTAGIMHVLAVSKELNVPVWYGEGRSGNPEMAVFYDMLAYYGIGFNQWSWKACEGKDADGINLWTYRLPSGWDRVYAYIKDGGARPSYAESIAIFDEMLENLKIENCTCDEERARYTLHQQGITLPAAGYKPGAPGDGSFSSVFAAGNEEGSVSGEVFEGNAWKYRIADGTRLQLRDGLTPPSAHFGPPAPGPRRSALSELELQLRGGEYVTYTIRDVKTDCPVVLHYHALSNAQIEVSVNGTARGAVTVPAAKSGEGTAQIAVIEPTEEADVKISVCTGQLVIECLEFLN